jgi:hypothetical protein
LYRTGPPIAGLLLVVLAVVIVVGMAADVRGRASSPDVLARSYFTALEQGDVDAALATLPSESRDRWTPFVENLAGNQFRVSGIATRWPSLLERMTGARPGPLDVTVFVAITTAEDEHWEATPRVPITQINGQPYLTWPPLAPEPE